MKSDESDQPIEGEMRVSDWMSSKKEAKAPAVNPPPTPKESKPEAFSLAQTVNGNTDQTPPPPAPPGAKRAVLQAPMLEPLRRESAPISPRSFAFGKIPSPTVKPDPSDEVSSEEDLAEDQLPFDVFRYAGGILQRKFSIFFVGLLGLVGGFAYGYLSGDNYRASATLIFRDVPTSIQVAGSQRDYKPKELTVSTLTEILSSEPLLQRVGSKLHPPLTVKKLSKRLTMKPEGRGECLTLTFEGAPDGAAAVNGANTWAEEGLQFTKELQAQEAREARSYLDHEQLQNSINSGRTEIAQLRAQFSDQNPLVREKLEQLQRLEDQLRKKDEESKMPPPDLKPGELPDDPQHTIMGYYNIISPATIEAVRSTNKWVKGMLFGVGFSAAGIFLMLGFSLLSEIMDRRVRTVAELEQAIDHSNLQKIPRVSAKALASNEVSTIWTRILGGSSREVVCFWTPHYHEQSGLVMQALLNLASKQVMPLIWVDTGMFGVRAPADFQQVELPQLGYELGSGRYSMKLNLQALSAIEAEQIGKAFMEIATRQKMPIWIGIQGQIQEPACSLARHVNRVKILAVLEAVSKTFWENESELLKQSVGSHVEWLAVNYVPWYGW